MERVRSDVAAVKEMLRQLDERSQRDSHYLRLAQGSLDLLVNASTAQLVRSQLGAIPARAPGESRLYGAHKFLTSGLLLAILSAGTSAVLNSAMLRNHPLAVGGVIVVLVLLLAVTNFFNPAG